MKAKSRYFFHALTLVALSTLTFLPSTTFAQGTAFTYQGRLNTGTNPAMGNFDLTFTLYGANSGGGSLAGPETNLAVAVTNGLFSVLVDFGAGVFTGSSNWLQIGVRSNGTSVAFSPLSPRNQVTPTPYAITAENVSGVVSLGQLPATVSLLSDPGTANFFAGQDSGNASLTGSDNTGLGFGALFVNSSGSYNTADGVGALSANTSGSFNSAYGAGALFFNTNGVNNSAGGFDALLSNTSGNNNTAYGIDALFDNTTGSQNTAEGAGALFYNTIGGNNVAVGYQALLANTNQNEETAIGAQALYANTTGSQNTGLGYRALLNNQSGSENTASGVAALESNTSGSYNTANGAFALNVNTNGSYVTANGYAALEYNTSGSYNTASGFQSLWQNTTGSDNVALGFEALFGNYSGNGNIGLGYQAGYSHLSGDNNIYIGNTGISTESGIIRLGTPGTQTETIIAGGLNVDPGGQNAGNVSSYALTFGVSSGEGVASQRTGGSTGSGQFGLEFYTDFANRMTILQDGYVGVGTASPSQALEVNGNFVLVDGASAGNGNGPIDAYIGGNGSGSDVQVGSLNSLISNVAFYNWGNSSYMHIYCSSITIEGGSDLAEPFKISSEQGEVPQGAVVVIDEQNPGRLKMSDQSYDTRVAGVVSGANGINPGIQMQQQGLLEGGKNVALTGRVYVQADTVNGAIKPGDLLTTSSTPGHAMKVTDHARAAGAILGKAMTALSEGQGMVLVLVTLQ